MLRLKWTTPAADQLESAQNYYHALNPMAATRMAMRIVEAAQILCEQPGMGRHGRVPGTREWVVSKTPYVLVYRICDDALEMLYVWHEAQDWVSRTE